MIQRRKKRTKLVIYILTIIVALETIYLLISFINNSLNKTASNSYSSYEEMSDVYKKYKEINEDYICQITLNNGSIDIPVFQAKSLVRKSGGQYTVYDSNGNIVTGSSIKDPNDVYKWLNYETMEFDSKKAGETVYMDYRNNVSDQNVIIYGHDFKGGNKKKGLTAFEALSSKKDKYMKLNMYLDGEIREYKLWAVYTYKADEQEYATKCQYSRNNYSYGAYSYDANYMKNYIAFVNSIKKYDTGIELSEGNKTLTLVLNPVPDSNEIEICVFKLDYSARYTKNQ